MRPRQEYKTTNNRFVYNRLRKYILERDAEIRCDWCGYHRGENDKRKFYIDDRHPSWKLTSKNRKQWMESKIRKEYGEYGYYSDTIFYLFKGNSEKGSYKTY